MNNRQAQRLQAPKNNPDMRGFFVGCEAKGLLACEQLRQQKRVRIEAEHTAKAIDPNAWFRLEMSDKIAEAVAKSRRLSVRDFKAAAKFREKNRAKG